MNRQSSIRAAFCDEYGKLLEEGQRALKMWNERREEIYRSRLSGKEFDDEFLRLQAKYARALWKLQQHAHDCSQCLLVRNAQVMPEIEGCDSENISSALSDRELYIC